MIAAINNFLPNELAKPQAVFLQQFLIHREDPNYGGR